MDVRDGNSGVLGTSGLQNPKYKGIPYYMRKLNEFVRTFAKAFDKGMNPPKDGHYNGFGLKGG